VDQVLFESSENLWIQTPSHIVSDQRHLIFARVVWRGGPPKFSANIQMNILFCWCMFQNRKLDATVKRKVSRSGEDGRESAAVRRTRQRAWRRGSGTYGGLSHTLAEKTQNVLSYLWWNLLGPDSAGYGDRLLIGIQEVNAIRANTEVALEISLERRIQRII
jgi:hypothetical protein